MTTRLQKVESTVANEPPVPEYSREEPMIADRAVRMPLEAHDAPDRKLRNRIIFANAVAWIVIIILIRLIFF